MSLLNLYYSYYCPLVSLQLIYIFLMLHHPSWPQDTYWRHNLTRKYCYCKRKATSWVVFVCLFCSKWYFYWWFILNPSSLLQICCITLQVLCGLLILQKGKALHFSAYWVTFYFSRLFLQFINTVVILILSCQTYIAQLVFSMNLIFMFSIRSWKSDRRIA